MFGGPRRLGALGLGRPGPLVKTALLKATKLICIVLKITAMYRTFQSYTLNELLQFIVTSISKRESDILTLIGLIISALHENTRSLDRC